MTGEIVATSGTEGPGFTDMICGIAAAYSARSPILVLASNKTIFAEDTERGIQDGYQQPTTDGLRASCKRLITAARIHEYAGYAFRQLRSGVPKPVHMDFPAEIASARFRDGPRCHGSARVSTSADARAVAGRGVFRGFSEQRGAGLHR